MVQLHTHWCSEHLLGCSQLWFLFFARLMINHQQHILCSFTTSTHYAPPNSIPTWVLNCAHPAASPGRLLALPQMWPPGEMPSLWKVEAAAGRNHLQALSASQHSHNILAWTTCSLHRHPISGSSRWPPLSPLCCHMLSKLTWMGAPVLWQINQMLDCHHLPSPPTHSCLWHPDQCLHDTGYTVLYPCYVAPVQPTSLPRHWSLQHTQLSASCDYSLWSWYPTSPSCTGDIVQWWLDQMLEHPLLYYAHG